MTESTSRLPRIFRVRSRFERPRVEDAAATVRSELRRIGVMTSIRTGDRVAITAGSRGIADLPAILGAVVAEVRAAGGQPFLVPAMGSHGGATADGQRRVLQRLGVTESTCGCPIIASMETVVIGNAPLGFPIHFDRAAHEAQHVIVCNRIKPHTTLEGTIQSGLLKMLLIGLGKSRGAYIYHRAILEHRFDAIVQQVAHEVLARCPILAGVAIVENAYDETAVVEAVRPADFVTREPELLRLAYTLMPRLPFDPVDLLLVDRIGKDISGTGLDTSLVGRKHDPSSFGRPIETAGASAGAHVRYIAVRDLTAATEGNAAGIGLVEFCRKRVIDKMDRDKTRLNAITAGHVEAARLPVDFQSDREILETALGSAGLAPLHATRLLWIRDTLGLAEVECSERYWESAARRSDLEILSELRSLPIGPHGNLPDDWFDHPGSERHESERTS